MDFSSWQQLKGAGGLGALATGPVGPALPNAGNPNATGFADYYRFDDRFARWKAMMADPRTRAAAIAGYRAELDGTKAHPDAIGGGGWIPPTNLNYNQGPTVSTAIDPNAPVAGQPSNVPDPFATNPINRPTGGIPGLARPNPTNNPPGWTPVQHQATGADGLDLWGNPVAAAQANATNPIARPSGAPAGSTVQPTNPIARSSTGGLGGMSRRYGNNPISGRSSFHLSRPDSSGFRGY
jgi:hypothetical protein